MPKSDSARLYRVFKTTLEGAGVLYIDAFLASASARQARAAHILGGTPSLRRPTLRIAHHPPAQQRSMWTWWLTLKKRPTRCPSWWMGGDKSLQMPMQVLQSPAQKGERQGPNRRRNPRTAPKNGASCGGLDSFCCSPNLANLCSVRASSCTTTKSACASSFKQLWHEDREGELRGAGYGTVARAQWSSAPGAFHCCPEEGTPPIGKPEEGAGQHDVRGCLRGRHLQSVGEEPICFATG